MKKLKLFKMDLKGEITLVGDVNLHYDAGTDVCQPPTLAFQVDKTQTELTISFTDKDQQSFYFKVAETESFYTQFTDEDQPFHIWYVRAHLLEVAKILKAEYDWGEAALKEYAAIIDKLGYSTNPFNFVVLTQSGAVSAFEKREQTIIQIKLTSDNPITIDAKATGLMDLEAPDKAIFSGLGPIVNMN